MKSQKGPRKCAWGEGRRCSRDGQGSELGGRDGSVRVAEFLICLAGLRT